MAFTHSSAKACNTMGVVGQGPSSKVSTTSPGRRKSYILKCSKPKPGPPVVSISTTRDTPSAYGFLHDRSAVRATAGVGGTAAAVSDAGDTFGAGAALIGAGSGVIGPRTRCAWATLSVARDSEMARI